MTYKGAFVGVNGNFNSGGKNPSFQKSKTQRDKAPSNPDFLLDLERKL